MQKPFLLIAFFCLIVVTSFAQTEESLVRTGPRGLYVEHKVAAKENFYSLGRTFGIHPKHLATFNSLDMSKGLSLGQTIYIPLSDSNVNRNTAEGTPLYYKSALKQTVGGISAISKTTADNIRKWNNLTNDIAPNAPVIIGYLVSSGEVPVVAAVADKGSDSVPAVKNETENKKEIITAQTVKQDEPKPREAVKNETVNKEAKAIAKEDVPKNSAVVVAVSTGDGYFKTHFAEQIKTNPLSKDETVTAGIFKITSAVTPGKYYILIDGVEPGTIIKIINPSNNKAVFAKVLGQVSDIHQNQGLNARISNSAAAMLNIAETDKFIVKLDY